MPQETQSDIADRIDRHGDRYHNAGDFRNEAEARDVARRARNAPTPEAAREIERSFNAGHGYDNS